MKLIFINLKSKMHKIVNSQKQKPYLQEGNTALKLDENYNIQTTQNNINNLYIITNINSTSKETTVKSIINKIQTLINSNIILTNINNIILTNINNIILTNIKNIILTNIKNIILVNAIKLYNNIINTKPWTYENTPIKIKKFLDALFINGILIIISLLTGILIGILFVV